MSSDIFSASLLELGLSQTEQLTYRILLQSPDITISEIAKTVQRDRKMIYRSLERLLQNGLVEKKSNNWIAQSPKVVLALLQQQHIQKQKMYEQFEKVLPQIEYQIQSPTREIEVQVYKGKNQFIQLFDQTLDAGAKEFLTFGNHENYFDLVNFEYFNLWKTRRIQKGIYSRDLTFANSYTNSLIRNDKTELRQTELLPLEYKTEATFTIVNDTFMVWNPVIPKVIVINDRLIANTFRQMFELIWDNTELKK